MSRARELDLLVVLHSVQPLTTDLESIGAARVVVLTDGPPSGVSRADAPVPREIVAGLREQWAEIIAGLAGGRRVEVVTNDEFCLDDCRRVREQLGLRRVTPAGVDGYRDKVVMKHRLAAAGIRVPRWVPLERIDEGGDLPLPDGLDYPVVAKPRIGSNSRGVRSIQDEQQWRSWVQDKSGTGGWQVEQFISGQMCFVDGLVVDGYYEQVLVGRYLGGLLPGPEVSVLGGVSVPGDDRLWDRAGTLGRQVADTLGTDGRFATHLEFFDQGHNQDLVVLEVCARAPGALVSEMVRVVSGHNLETAHLQVQAELPAPIFSTTGSHAAWISVLARTDQI